MDLRQKIGQLLMIGIAGTEPGVAGVELVSELDPGGIIIFSNNIRSTGQITDLIGALQSRATATGRADRLLVALDQEGGPVAILAGHICPVFPSNWEHGEHYKASGNYAAVIDQARTTARVLRELGFNMNLAPVVDVVTDSGNEIIGIRAYGDDREVVAHLGREYITALQAAGVIATAKHFPGHGPTAIDSHQALPTVNMDRAKIDHTHLYPFRAAISAGVDAVMTAHLRYPAVSKLPATLSSAWLTGVLRQELGFGGVIITDDMNMLAIADNFSRAEAAVAAIQAGVDILLICARPEIQREMFNAVLAAAESGAIGEQVVDAAVGRVLALKRKYGLLA